MAGLRTYRGSKTTPEGEALYELVRVPVLSGQLLEVTFAGNDSVSVRHSLGRPYRGGFVVASTNPQTQPSIVPLAPKLAADPKTFAVIGAESNWSGTVTMWVF